MLPITIRGISTARGTIPVTAIAAVPPAIIEARTTDAGRGRRRRTHGSILCPPPRHAHSAVLLATLADQTRSRIT
jgi:hypothetical protein